METKVLRGVAGFVIASVVACSPAIVEEPVRGDRATIREASFDKNSVLTDAELRDSTAMSADDVQAFLEETPWGHASVLATYEEDGRSAARIIHDASEKYGINPLELLVRVQMEQSLVYEKTASDETIAIAFGCGCPHSPVCSSKYEGFASQAECAAGTLSRSMDRALTSSGTASGWRKGEEKLTQDQVEVIPQNAATAALYTYTPWVGEAGGGREGVGGASLHYLVWTRFADAIGYGAVKPSPGNASPDQVREEVLDAGAPEDETPAPPPGNAGADGVDPDEADAGPPPKTDGDPPSGDGKPEKDDSAGDDGEGSAPPPDEGEDDDDILGEGNVPPASPPPPRSSGTRGRGSSNDDLPVATEEELAPKKTSSAGCSSTGGPGGGNGALAALALGALLAGRRRRAGA